VLPSSEFDTETYNPFLEVHAPKINSMKNLNCFFMMLNIKSILFWSFKYVLTLILVL